MKKASIFSREYEKKLRRKRCIMLFIILIFSIFIIYYIINFSNFNAYVKNVYYSMISSMNKNDDTEVVHSVEGENENLSNNNDITQDNIPNNNTEEINENFHELVQEIQLNDSENISVVYNEMNDMLIYVGLRNDFLKDYIFDISPEKDKILIENLNNQSTYMLDEKFNLYKLDPEFFYSNSARTSFYKDNVMENYNDYNWYKNAKFLDNSTIIYVSNLPWFGSSEQYVWRTDISDPNNIMHYMTNVSGQNIEFGELTENGIKVNINNEIKLLTFNFVLS